MAGSKKQAASTRRNQGEDFYKRIGAKGGATRTEKTKLRGFGGMNERRATAARKGQILSDHKVDFEIMENES